MGMANLSLSQALRLASLPMWFTISPRQLSTQLAANPQLARPWKFLQVRGRAHRRLAQYCVGIRAAACAF